MMLVKSFGIIIQWPQGTRIWKSYSRHSI